MLFRIRIVILFTIAVLISAQTLFAQDSSRHGKDSLVVKPSANSDLKSKVVYNAIDSIRFDVSNQKMYLYGEGMVTYENMELKADYIEFDMSKNIAFSRGKRDSAGNVVLDSSGYAIGDPEFKDGGKSFDAKELTYNFHTKKGKIREVTTQEGEAYIHAKDAKKDTGDVYFIKNGRYTTCDLEHPHFYLNATKIKIIPDDKIISGPAYLAIADVPTPLFLPFGVFPNKKGRKSGVLIPAYGESALGFFLKDGGYYFGLSDYFDVALRGDIYSKGSFGIKSNTNYSKRYGFTGFLGLSFAQIQISEKEFKDYRVNHDFFVRWQHIQDPKASPTSHFSANVNAGSSTYQTYSSTNANDYLSNTFSSNIAWNKSWQGRPFNLSVNMLHSQTKRPRADKKGYETLLDVTLPEVAFTRTRLYPFKRREQIGKPNVLEKIGLSYSINTKNQLSTYDSLVFVPKTTEFQPNVKDLFRNGLKASVPISTSMNIGPLIISPSFGANGYGYLRSYNKTYDTTSNKLITDTLPGFKYAYDYNTALSFSTKIYGMFSFKNARVKGVRHVMTPNASLSYRPDFAETRFGFYDSVRSSKADTTKHLYSHFENGVYGYPASGKSAFLNLALNNNLEMKLRPAKKDTSGTDRKVVLIESFGISSSYNIAAEQFRWSNINVNGRTRLFKVLDITFNGIIDQYAYDTLKRLDKFQFNVNGQIGKLTSGMFSLGTSLRSLVKKKDEKKKPAGKKHLPSYDDELSYILAHPDYYVDFDVPWDLNVNYNVLYSRLILLDTSLVTQSLTFNGNLSVTDKWKVGFRSGFDFIAKDFTYTSFDIYRDLHCWEMRLNWIPFGLRKSYLLTIAVKASVLQDLKLNRKRDWYDYN